MLVHVNGAYMCGWVLHLETEIQYGKCQVIPKFCSVFRQEEKVIIEGEEGEVEQSQHMGPDIHCLIGAYEGAMVCVCVCVCVCVVCVWCVVCV